MTNDPVLSSTSREHLLALLADLATVSLSERWWRWVLARIDTLRQGLAAGDADAVRVAIIDLERVDEVRAVPLGAEPLRMPESVRERYDALVHTLGGPAAPSR